MHAGTISAFVTGTPLVMACCVAGLVDCIICSHATARWALIPAYGKTRFNVGSMSEHMLTSMCSLMLSTLTRVLPYAGMTAQRAVAFHASTYQCILQTQYYHLEQLTVSVIELALAKLYTDR